MDRIEVAGAALVGIYLGWVVLSALRTGAIRYRTRVHQRAEEPRTYWLTVGWFGVLALVALAFAALRGGELFR